MDKLTKKYLERFDIPEWIYFLRVEFGWNKIRAMTTPVNDGLDKEAEESLESLWTSLKEVEESIDFFRQSWSYEVKTDKVLDKETKEMLETMDGEKNKQLPNL